MAELYPIDPPFSLDDLTKRIETTSNFRFAWQFYSFAEIDPRSPDGVRAALNCIVAEPLCHQFLRDSFVSMSDDVFDIELVHDHCRFESLDGEPLEIRARRRTNGPGTLPCGTRLNKTRFFRGPGRLEKTLASIANNSLGAYSRHCRDASVEDCAKVTRTFSSIGEFLSWQLRPGTVEGCPVCQDYNSELFTTWYYGVAWDWCFIATWPERKTLWLGCLTDTD